MNLVQNEKYRFSTNDDGLIETFVAAYIGTEVFHYHGGFDFFLVLQETLSDAKTTVAAKNILNVTPLANIDDLFQV